VIWPAEWVLASVFTKRGRTPPVVRNLKKCKM